MHPYSPYMRAPAAATYRPGYHGYGASGPSALRRYRVIPPTEGQALGLALDLAERVQNWGLPTYEWMFLTPHEQDAFLRFNSVANATLGPLLWEQEIVTRPPQNVIEYAVFNGYGASPFARLGKNLAVIWGLAAVTLFVAFKAKK